MAQFSCAVLRPVVICNGSKYVFWLKNLTLRNSCILAFLRLTLKSSRYSQNHPRRLKCNNNFTLGSSFPFFLFPFFHIRTTSDSSCVTMTISHKKKSSILIFVFEINFHFTFFPFLFVWEIASWFRAFVIFLCASSAFSEKGQKKQQNH